MGCLMESFLSMELGYLSKSDFATIHGYLKNISFPKLDEKKIYDALRVDKKGKKGVVRTVLIDQIGHALEFEGQFCREVSLSEINRPLSKLGSVDF